MLNRILIGILIFLAVAFVAPFLATLLVAIWKMFFYIVLEVKI